MANVNLIVGHHYMVPCLRNLICNTNTYIDVKNVIYVRNKFEEPLTDIGRILFNDDSITLINNYGVDVETFPRSLSTDSLYPANTNGIYFEIVSTNNVLEISDEYIYDFDNAISLGNYWVTYQDDTTSSHQKTTNVVIDGDNRGHGNIEIVLSDITTFPLKIELENIDDTTYSFYKNEIHVFVTFNDGDTFSEWDNLIDITSLCIVKETSFTIPACIFSYDSQLFSIKNHLITDSHEVLFGGVNGGIQKIEGESEYLKEVNWGEDVMFLLEVPNYHFTEESTSLIYDWIFELAEHEDGDGNIVNDIGKSTNGIEVFLDENDSTKAYIVFDEVYNDLSIEDFDIFETTSLSPNGRTTQELALNKEFELVSSDLIGCEIEQITEEIVYKEPVNFRIIVEDGYLDFNYNELHVYRNEIDLIETGEASEDDGVIHINEAYGDVSIVVHCSHVYTIKLAVGREIYTLYASRFTPLKLENRNTTQYPHRFYLEADGGQVFDVPLTTDLDTFVGLRSRIGNFILPVDTTIDRLDLEPYSTNYEVRFTPIIETGTESTDIVMNLYNMNCEKNVVDKTDSLVSVGTLTGTLRESCSMVSPIMTIVYSTIPLFNYVYIPNFKRYFFVTDVTNVRNGLWNISLKVDVLMTYRNQIRSQKCIIARNEFEYNPNIKDDTLVALNEYDYQIITFGSNYNGMFEEPEVKNMDYIVQVVAG